MIDAKKVLRQGRARVKITCGEHYFVIKRGDNNTGEVVDSNYPLFVGWTCINFTNLSDAVETYPHFQYQESTVKYCHRVTNIKYLIKHELFRDFIGRIKGTFSRCTFKGERNKASHKGERAERCSL